MNALRPLQPGVLAMVFALGLAGCGETAKLPDSAGIGPNPILPPPHKTLIPTVYIAPAKGWPEGAKPVAAQGTSVAAFAAGSTIRAGSTCCPTATCWSPRPTRRRSPRTARASRAGS